LFQIFVIGVGSSVFVMTPSFRSLHIIGTCAYFFAGFVLATLVPVILGIAICGWNVQNYRISLLPARSVEI
jgi:hypothetical protein